MLTAVPFGELRADALADDDKQPEGEGDEDEGDGGGYQYQVAAHQDDDDAHGAVANVIHRGDGTQPR